MASIQKFIDFSLCLIDKPPGPSSHEVSAYVKKILNAKKTGHSGTLDPQVSGLLLIGIGRGTRFLHYLSRLPKEYVGIMKFHKKLSEEKIRLLFSRFTGEIVQTPPKESAVRRIPRKRKVYYFVPLEIMNHRVLFMVKCEAGTYIRTLCSDMGATCGGAHLCELRRLSIGNLHVDNAYTLQQLSDAAWLWREKEDGNELKKILRPPESFLNEFKKIHIKDTALQNIASGAPLYALGIKETDEGITKGETVALMHGGHLVAMAQAVRTSEEIRKLGRGIVAYPKFVVIKSGG